MFQHCMLSLSSDMVERFLKIFMDDFSIHGDSFNQCLHHLELVVKKCIEKNFDIKLGKISFYGQKGNRSRAQNFKPRN